MTVASLLEQFTLERLQGLFDASHDSVFWRHDVDFDVDCALQMALAEHDRGIQATYFVRLRGPYNPFQRGTVERLHGIVGLGHRLAPHVDLGLPRHAHTGPRLLAGHAERDHAVLAAEFPSLTRDVSFHAPPRAVVWQDVPGFQHALGPAWEGRYVADSRGRFLTSPEDEIATGEPVQINLHPEWWFLPEPARTELHEQELAAP